MSRPALVVERDPRGALVDDMGAPLFVDEGPLTLMAANANANAIPNAAPNADGTFLRISVRAERDSVGAWTACVEDGVARAPRTLAVGDGLQWGDVAVRLDLVDDNPLARAAAAGPWIVLGVDNLRFPARARAFSPTARTFAWFVSNPVHDARGVATEWAARANIVYRYGYGALTHRVYDVAPGVPLTAVFALGDDADPACTARLLVDARAQIEDAWPTLALGVRDFIVTWDGRTVFRPGCSAIPHVDDRDFHVVGPDHDLPRRERDLGAALAAIAAAAAPRALAPIVDVDNPALGLVERSRAVDAFDAEHGRADDETMAAWIRALFPDRWRAHEQLIEQLAMLDVDGVAWLLSRGAS